MEAITSASGYKYMSIVSYAQNFEDVMLWRALGHIPNGCYIDVGAQDPVVDSVSLAFYEKGWRGVHVEATPTYAAKLLLHRSDELVIQAAVNDVTGFIVLHEIPGGGLSTGDLDIAQAHTERGFNIQAITVPCITLEEVFTRTSSKEIHWLKIDVEGMEHQVLKSWGSCEVLPWIVVIESTLPLTKIESHVIWEHCLVERGYSFVYFDGLNRYYISPDHKELASAFGSPPNVFDDFSLAGNSSAPFCLKINETHLRAVDEIRQQFTLSHLAQVSAKEASDKSLDEAHKQLRDFRSSVNTIETTLLHQNAIFLEFERTLRSEAKAALNLLEQTKQATVKCELLLQSDADTSLIKVEADLTTCLQKLASTESEYVEKIASMEAQIKNIQSEAAKKEYDFNEMLTTLHLQAERDKQDFSENISRREQGFTEQLISASAIAEANLIQHARANTEQLADMQRKLDTALATIVATKCNNDKAQDRINELLQIEQSLSQKLLDAHSQFATTVDKLSDSHALQLSQLRARLMDEIETAHQKNTYLTQLLFNAKQSLESIQASFIWRMTGPLRKLTSQKLPERLDK